MHETNIESLDLNLLVTLDVLLRELSVTRTARRLGRSQPAVSHALARLREALDDPLLVPSRGGMRPTPFAEALATPLTRALEQLSAVLELERDFDPAVTRRAFGLGCPDALAILLGDLLGWLGASAPHARLVARLPEREALERGLELGRHDLALATTPEHPSASLRQLSVGAVSWRVLARRGHPALTGQGLDLDAWLSFPHVVVDSGSGTRSAVGGALAAAGRERHVGLIVPGFLLGVRAVAATDMLFTAPHIVADDATSRFDLVSLAPPIALPGPRVAVLWHERWDSDPGHRWFREGVGAIARSSWARAHAASAAATTAPAVSSATSGV